MKIPNQLDSNRQWVKQIFKDNGKRYRTESYTVWLNMKARCTVNSVQQKLYPHYQYCEMSEVFSNFNTFVPFHMHMVGFGLENYHLDKDILIPGNKLYSEDTCVLIPGALNIFATDHRLARGLWPQGVSFYKTTSTFKAEISINGKHKHIGYFSTPEAAFEAYKAAKYAERDKWVARLEAGEFVVDQKVIDALKIWEIPNA